MSGSRIESGMAMGPGAEFDAIRRMLQLWGEQAVGIGDDAATLTPTPGRRLVVTVDASVEDVHFRPEWIGAAEIGHRAAAAALSDLAAMAATPLAAFIALALPSHWRAELDDLARGIASGLAGTVIAGGNVSDAQSLSITITVMGEADRVLHRSGVRPGDALYVTGLLGGPGAALRAFTEGRTPPPLFRDRFVAPAARIREAAWLAGHGATAAIDISDGLLADAGHLAAASGLTLELDVGVLPLLPGISPSEGASSGEEYELLVAAPVGLDVAGFAREFGIPLTEIGIAKAGESEVVLRGETRVANASGHDHLST